MTTTTIGTELNAGALGVQIKVDDVASRRRWTEAT